MLRPHAGLPAPCAPHEPSPLPLPPPLPSHSRPKTALADAMPAPINGMRDYIIVLRNDINLQPNATANWPPPGGQTVPHPVQVLGEGVKPTVSDMLAHIVMTIALLLEEIDVDV